ncbi:Protein Y39A3CL.4 c [Aphelenchoides avenae]|nr:Protein Y39A3CL.4 c [Aphelenchus avenae]
MGHKHSHHRHHDDSHVNQALNEDIRRTFDELSSDKQSAKFGGTLSTVLWEFLSDKNAEKRSVTSEEFYRKAHLLLVLSKVEFIELLLPAKRLLAACIEVNDIEERPEDGSFLDSLIAEMTSAGESAEAVYAWINGNCPRLCDTVQAKVLGTFSHSPEKVGDFTSTILTPAQILILRNCLPITVYFGPKTKTTEESDEEADAGKYWEPLYVSKQHGLSINRFETYVFHYRGPTVATFKMLDGRIFSIACDEEWRHLDKKFGGPNTVLVQILPAFKRYDANGPPIYCNFKLKMSPFGIMFGTGDEFKVDEEMSNVAAIEVWGCAGSETFQKQKSQKLWLQKEAEKKNKMAADDWEDNPDKQIMEMHGFRFSNERQRDRERDRL